VEKRKIFFLAIISIVFLTIASGTFFYINSMNNEQFEGNLEKAYSSYTNLSSKIEKNNHDQQSADYFKMTNVKKGLKSLNDIKKTNNETKNYLNDCLKSANDDVEKEYINLLINQTDLIGNLIDVDIRSLKFKEDYLNGKIGVTAHNNEMNKMKNKINSTFKKVDENSKHISNFLAENPDFEDRLNNLDIGMEFMGGSFIGSLILKSR